MPVQHKLDDVNCWLADLRDVVLIALHNAWTGEAHKGPSEGACWAGHVRVMGTDEWAHVALIATLAHTDDTALLSKAILPELMVNRRQSLYSHCPAVLSSCYSHMWESTARS